MTPSHDSFFVGVHCDFSSLTMNPARARVLRTNNELRCALGKAVSMPIPSSKNSVSLIPLECHNETRGRKTLVNTKGAVESPSGRTLKI